MIYPLYQKDIFFSVLDFLEFEEKLPLLGVNQIFRQFLLLPEAPQWKDFLLKRKVQPLLGKERSQVFDHLRLFAKLFNIDPEGNASKTSLQINQQFQDKKLISSILYNILYGKIKIQEIDKVLITLLQHGAHLKYQGDMVLLPTNQDWSGDKGYITVIHLCRARGLNLNHLTTHTLIKTLIENPTVALDQTISSVALETLNDVLDCFAFDNRDWDYDSRIATLLFMCTLPEDLHLKAIEKLKPSISLIAKQAKKYNKDPDSFPEPSKPAFQGKHEKLFHHLIENCVFSKPNGYDISEDFKDILKLEFSQTLIEKINNLKKRLETLP